MARGFWLVGLVAAFALGLAVGRVPHMTAVDPGAVDRELAASRPDRRGAGRPTGGDGSPGGGTRAGASAGPTVRTSPAMAGAVDQATDRHGVALARPGQRAPDREAGAVPPSVTGSAPAVPASAGNADTALERFHKYLADMAELRGRARSERTQQFLEELRAMGPAGVEVLTRVLGSNASSDERRAAAQLLGDLKAPGALPALMDVLGRDDDVLLRRTAASALRRLQTPDADAAMQSLLATPGEDRYVRMSAASGLAHMGRPQGTQALVQIFDEANADGRGRDMAFRALTTLSDDRTLSFMRRVVTSDAELTYRLQAIRYLATQGDRQAVSALQQVVHAPGEQPSIRDAAARALASIGGG